MDTPTGHDQNADQIAYWNGPGGKRWADRQAAQDILLKPIADALIDRAKPSTSPARMPGSDKGKVIVAKVRHRLAPKERAAPSSR